MKKRRLSKIALYENERDYPKEKTAGWKKAAENAKKIDPNGSLAYAVLRQVQAKPD